MLVVPGIILAIALAQVHYMAWLRRRLWEDYAEGVEEELPEPCGPPEWIAAFAKGEKELAALGFRRLLYLHNKRSTEDGLANCSVVYLSPDGCFTLGLDFVSFPLNSFYWLRPHWFPDLYEGNSWGARSRLANGNWLMSWSQYPPQFPDETPHYSNNYFPEAKTPARLAAAHRTLVAKRERTAGKVRPLKTPEDYLEDSREERMISSNYQLERLHRFGGIGALMR